jgi:hypothetical protein
MSQSDDLPMVVTGRLGSMAWLMVPQRTVRVGNMMSPVVQILLALNIISSTVTLPVHVMVCM